MTIQGKQDYKTYNFRIIWKAAESNFDQLSGSDKVNKYFAVGAVFLYFASFEGYLNWLGSRIDKEVWEKEIEIDFFSREPYKGTIGKYKYLRKMLYLPAVDASRRPFQTLTICKKIRDFIAHPKIEEGSRLVNIETNLSPKDAPCELEKLLLPAQKKSKQVRDDIKFIIEELHLNARKFFNYKITEEDAFGPNNLSITSI